ncbi:MAG TPA: ABC transporter permease [Nocardioidaceae bacterium]|nr:ABC transporter permease [Nocardioidaceae bacterium]
MTAFTEVRTPRRGFVVPIPKPRWMRGRATLIVGVLLVLAMVVACVGAPLWTSSSPTAIDPAHRLLPVFSPGHLLGTDDFGRDVLSRILYGGRLDLAIAFGATAVTLVVGTAFGLCAGHIRGKTGAIMMRIVDLFFAFPFVVLVIAIITILGSSLLNLFIALWAVSWVNYARISHGQALSSNNYGYVVASKALGFSHLRIMLRHQLPSVLPGVIIFAMVDAVGNVLLAAALGFLGLGIPPPNPEWGSMISDGQNFIFSDWSLAIMPGIALVVLGLGLSLIGDGLSDLLRPQS